MSLEIQYAERKYLTQLRQGMSIEFWREDITMKLTEIGCEEERCREQGLGRVMDGYGRSKVR